MRGESPAAYLRAHLDLFTDGRLPPGPVLDLASGACENGLFLARHGIATACWDISAEALARAEEEALRGNLPLSTRAVDLEDPAAGNPLPQDAFSAIVVFRYLHRPLMACIKKAVKPGGVVLYETFTTAQARFGHPNNPVFLLRPGELPGHFAGFEILHHFEGILPAPERAVARLCARKPSAPRAA